MSGISRFLFYFLFLFLQAHVRKIKRRGDAIFAYIRKFRFLGMPHSQVWTRLWDLFVEPRFENNTMTFMNLSFIVVIMYNSSLLVFFYIQSPPPLSPPLMQPQRCISPAELINNIFRYSGHITNFIHNISLAPIK